MACFIIALVLICVLVYFSVRSNKSSYDTDTTYEYQPLEDVRPLNRPAKISAEITDVLDNRVRTYCSKHSLSISDLIRKAVTDYMDRNP